MEKQFCHMELQTGDVDKARDFYTGLFAWTVQEMPMGDFTYTMLKTAAGENEMGGGIMQKASPDMPTQWLSYVLVEDVDASQSKAKELGGQVIAKKTPVENMGTFGVVTDPTGAAIGLWQPAKKD